MKLIINRISEWFNTEFPELDHYYVCMKLLEKLSTNQKRGLIYDKLSLVRLVSPSSNQEMIGNIDKAIVYLLSRGLIEKKKITDFRWDLFITPLGIDALGRFKEKNNETK